MSPRSNTQPRGLPDPGRGTPVPFHDDPALQDQQDEFDESGLVERLVEADGEVLDRLFERIVGEPPPRSGKSPKAGAPKVEPKASGLDADLVAPAAPARPKAPEPETPAPKQGEKRKKWKFKHTYDDAGNLIETDATPIDD